MFSLRPGSFFASLPSTSFDVFATDTAGRIVLDLKMTLPVLPVDLFDDVMRD